MPDEKIKCPLTPVVPAFTVCSTTLPLDVATPAPDNKLIIPPVPSAVAVESPAFKPIAPPSAIVPVPTTNLMSPPFPAVASPEVRIRLPLVPLLVVPEANSSNPLTPEVPALTVCIFKTPLEVAVPLPLLKETAPPVAAWPIPPEISKVPPRPPVVEDPVPLEREIEPPY